MNGTVWAFGDSFTRGCCVGGPIDGNYLEQPYVKIIAEKLQMKCNNKAREIMTFTDIFATITKHLQYIKKGDIVIAGPTSLFRIMYPTDYEYVQDYHGTEDTGEESLTGLNLPSIESAAHFINAKNVDRKKLKMFLIDWWENIVQPNEDAFNKFYSDYYTNWCSYFTSIGVPFYWWDNVWVHHRTKLRCKCGHWNQEYHFEFANILLTFMKDNPYGKLPNPAQPIIQL